MKTNGQTTGIKKKTIFAISALAVLSMILLMSFIIVSADADSGDGVTIELQNEDGSARDTLIQNTNIAFRTVTDLDGNVTYTVDAGTEIQMEPAYLVITADTGTYDLEVSATGADRSILSLTGINFCFTDVADATKVFNATLTSENNYTSIAAGDEGISAGKYAITVSTAVAYSDTRIVTEIPAITFTFKIEASSDWKQLNFISDGETIDTVLKEITSTVGEFPAVEKSGYRLIGWHWVDVDGTEHDVTSQTLVSEINPDQSEAEIIAEWAPISDGDWPKITDKLISEEISDNQKKQTWETTYLWQDGSKYIINSIITLDLEGKFIDGTVDSVFKVKGQEDCQLRIVAEDGRILVFVPQINNIFLQ